MRKYHDKVRGKKYLNKVRAKKSFNSVYEISRDFLKSITL